MRKQMESRVPKDDEIDLRELLGVLLDRKWLIIVATALFFVVGVLYALLARPVYQAQAMVQVESKVPSIPGLADLASLGGSGSTAATTEVALLTSRTVIGTAVDQLNLEVEIEPKRFPLLGNFFVRRFKPESENAIAPAKLGLSGYGWGGDVLGIHRLDVPVNMVDTTLLLEVGETGKDFVLFDEDGDEVLRGQAGMPAKGRGVTLDVDTLRANPGMRFEITRLRRLDVVAALQTELKAAEQGKDSGILQLSYQDTDPLRAEAFVQHVADAYVRQNVDRSSAEAASQLQFVKDQLPTIRRQVEQAQAAMSAYQSKSKSVDITMQTKGLLEQEVAVEASIQQLRLKQAEMDRSFTREHPAYRALLKQIGDLEGRKGGFQKQVGDLPETQQELLRLTRDLQVSNELYTALLNQAQQLDVARAGAVGNVRIVDPAIVDIANPVAPRKALIVAIATLLGAFLATVFVFLQRMLNPGIEDPAEIEALGLPVYAAIPLSVSNTLPKLRKGKHGTRVVADGRQHLLAVSAPADPTVEALRSLRTSLHFAMLEAKNNILTISGPRPGVGKTFVSTNLAAVIAQAGQRVLVIDADMRKGTLHKILGVSHQKGLSDVLGGKLSVDDVIHPVSGLDNMHYMVRGDIPPNPAELLMHPRFAQLLQEMSGRYDLVIVDTPPILAVTDPALVATHAGSSLLVTRFGVNQAKEIELTLQRFEQNGVQIKGAIFNAVEKRATGYYSYGYYEYKSDEKA
ncbi:polysaccharide biosynthesis tyrosine autokinase [Stenotrophomonas maltophilia]|uniref:polysaccharide biosynthesis tyrosine autokinase n=2 Tax=Lysobacteraceae TaxID=32033 RepID=UPI0013D98BD1|nr:polysaccharide biosynthesis tyrosine autokinase [Stenotrophomonas maltophilia]MBA0278628.1 polysaccharide biosynthesis tyrosine autokinase [Stenotrophomonas maltophilia]MBA0414055.1 polysaccharide biosynthesis tyrosine autokinase [Stenotrophomonas maltophilia]MBA0499352.1 polysaccharide biosynthesis tyrosine autokinase [Stenotrophomonas maltophilia]MBA0503998.1 polysaccharide biosynthesis tyrosine autokinase [Stenotrophomonas maltophilia]